MSEAFARVLSALQRGAGPEMAFRPYLLTSVRNAFYDRMRKDKRLDVTDEVPEDMGRVLAAAASSDDEEERRLAAAAFASLPERWQLVLWHTEVEGRSPAEVAPLLGLAPNAVAALAYRAREGLRQAYLNAHIQARPPAGCEDTIPKLGALRPQRPVQPGPAEGGGAPRGLRALPAHRGRAAGSRLAAAGAPHPAHRRHPRHGLPGRHRSRRCRAARLGAPGGPAGEGRRSGSPGGPGAGRGRRRRLLVVGSLALARSVTGGGRDETADRARRRRRRRRRRGGVRVAARAAVAAPAAAPTSRGPRRPRGIDAPPRPSRAAARWRQPIPEASRSA